MRQENIIKNIYSIEDVKVNIALKEKVLNNYCFFNVEDEWYDCVYDDWKEKLEKLGYSKVEINFSGFYSQGDGASFTGKIDALGWIKNNNVPKYHRLIKLFENNFIEQTGFTIKRDRWNNHVHWNTTSFFLDFKMYGNRGTDSENVSNLLEELEQEIFSHHQDLNREIYEDLEKEYEHLTSEESILENLECNDYEFDENGKIV